MDDDRHVGTFSWHQSLDQATINIFVPYETAFDDLEVLIDPPYLVAGIQGQMPLLKGKIYDSVDKDATHWNYEPTDNPRKRTTSTASTMSTQSSYAYVSDPEISSSFAASLDSAQVSDNDDSDLTSPERLHHEEQVGQRAAANTALSSTVPAFPQRSIASYPNSPQVTSMESSLSSLDSLQPSRPAKLLTIVLVKERATYWPRVIDGPVPDSYSPASTGPFTQSIDIERQKYNIDPTSLGLLGEEYLKTRNDKEEAFECFVRSWHYLHTPFATMRLVAHFVPVTTVVPAQNLSPSNSPPPPPRRGTVEYYVKCLGGSTGLAQLFLEAGLAHLDGIASKLLSSNYSPLNSIRHTDSVTQSSRGESSTQMWKRDRACARTYFERARRLAPLMDSKIPYLPEETDVRLVDRPNPASRNRGRPRRSPLRLDTTSSSEADAEDGAEAGSKVEFQMPSIYVEQGGRTLRPSDTAASLAGVKGDSTVRVRRRRQQASEALLEKPSSDTEDEDSTWYLYLPGLVGAGTALLVVSVVGALSFHSWRKNNN